MRWLYFERIRNTHRVAIYFQPLLVASLDNSLVIKGQQYVVPAPSVPPGTGVSAEPTAPPLTTATPPAPTAGMPYRQSSQHRHQPRAHLNLLRPRLPQRRRRQLLRHQLG